MSVTEHAAGGILTRDLQNFLRSMESSSFPEHLARKGAMRHSLTCIAPDPPPSLLSLARLLPSLRVGGEDFWQEAQN